MAETAEGNSIAADGKVNNKAGTGSKIGIKKAGPGEASDSSKGDTAATSEGNAADSGNAEKREGVSVEISDKAGNDDETEGEDAVIQTLQVMKAKKHSRGPRRVTGEKPGNVYTVAKINVDVITNEDIKNTLRYILFVSGKEFNKNTSRLVESILKKLIQEVLQKQVSKRNGITVPRSEISRRIHEIAERNGMTVEELGDEFRNRGINIEIFKQNLSSKILEKTIIQAMRGEVAVTNEEIAERKKQYAKEIKQKRYHVYEIYLRIDNKKSEKEVIQNASEILKLLKDGFDFVSLAENISQGNYRGNTGDLGWVSLNSLDKQTANAVAPLKPKEFSGTIRTNTGIKIVFLDDVAEAGRLGSSESVYKYIKARVQYRGGLFTSKDNKQAAELIGKLQKAATAEEMKKICSDNKITPEDKEESVQNPIMLNILNAACSKIITVEAPDDKNSVDLYYTISKESPQISEIKDEDFANEIRDKKASEIFSKTFTKVETMAYIKIDRENLEKLARELSKGPSPKQS
ncbi:MAG: peptidyl-prolyl cis-trans isomerase SurA [Holosporales bacterium]|nr:peptidyl-prolyl cis-trans isomerase SurA [Holosporales bacterium]